MNTIINKPKYCTYYESPVGALRLVSEDEFLIELSFSGRAKVKSDVQETEEPFRETMQQLDEYFAGKRKKFDVPIRLNGTPFQIHAWEALRKIPYGETISYKEQATQIGSHPRAVGLANGQNPIAIIVPCHRVIGANGSLVGFGGGLDRKRLLLNLESQTEF